MIPSRFAVRIAPSNRIVRVKKVQCIQWQDPDTLSDIDTKVPTMPEGRHLVLGNKITPDIAVGHQLWIAVFFVATRMCRSRQYIVGMNVIVADAGHDRHTRIVGGFECLLQSVDDFDVVL